MSSSVENTITLQSATNWANGILSKEGFDDAEMEARFLLSGMLKIPMTELYVNSDRSISIDAYSEFQKMVERRARKEPVSYILGHHHFMGQDLAVDPRALIPRPETELLVEAAIQCLKQKGLREPRILEIGTGSGCISISLAQSFPQADIHAVDISVDALDLARMNAKSSKVGSKISFYQSDLYSHVAPEKRGYFDMIISNPPYIATSELAELDKDLAYEPRIALDGGGEGLSLIRRLVNGASGYLKPKGLLIFEIGYKQGLEVQAACASAGFQDVELMKDYQGHDRIVKTIVS